MIVTPWTNGSPLPSGAGYGVKINVDDRNRYFQKEWQTVFVYLDGQPDPVEINVAKKSFWTKTCGELISAEIGRWMIKNSLAPWYANNPPKLILELIENNRFLLKKK
ncbi:MAG: hypothetical protein C3F13_02900 [Anaerolineales bacterium]|nr:MAG: hypothetical protein C3F13_02900 [Anaerolineales bacterium]